MYCWWTRKHSGNILTGSPSCLVQEESLHIQWGELRGGEEERGEEIMQNRAVCGDIIWRPDSNEPPGSAWQYIFRKCPVALKRLIVQENNFVELENTMGSPKKTKKIVVVDFHVIPPLNANVSGSFIRTSD